MSDIEVRLRTAMHEAVDGEEAAPEELITIVKRRHRRHLTRRAGASVVTALAIVVPMVIVLHGKISGSGSSSRHHVAAASKLPSTLRGLPMPAGTNIEVLISTAHGAAWYSTATHQTKPIRGLAALSADPQQHQPVSYQFTRINGGWAAWPSNVYSACDISVCAGPPSSYYFIAEGSLTATRIGAGYATDGLGIAPGIRPGTVWLVTYPRTTSSLLGSSFAQLVSSAGRPLGLRYRLPGNVLLSGGVGNYLLLSLNANAFSSELWDPRTRHVLARFDNVLAHGPEQIVWSRGCAPCQLRVTNVTTGRTVTTPLRGQPNSLNATLSDDGRLLAAQLPNGEVAVFNTVTRSLTRIPGTALRNANAKYFGWQNGGHRLVIAAGPISTPGPDQLAYWQPGDAHLYVATIRNPGEMEQIRTGTV
jgi:hypothetical protein